MTDKKELMAMIVQLRSEQPNNRKTWAVCEALEWALITRSADTPIPMEVKPAKCPVCEKKKKAKTKAMKAWRAKNPKTEKSA